ncbi:MAG: succinate dehydrogenase, hydrophobic membrane anchor protein [Pseudomonadota bacterium]
MVTQVTSFSGNGLADWIVQRVSAYILAAYTVLLVGILLLSGEMTFTGWRELFSQTWMQVFTLLALIASCAHAWVGMWTIGTDYIREHYFGSGADGIRLVYQVGCVLILACYLIWGIKILWGN